MASNGGTKIVVLVTSAFGGIGGIETFNRALIGALDQLAAQHNWRVHVLSLLDREALPGAHHYLRSQNMRARGFSGDRAQFALAASLASWGTDIVIIGHVNLAPLALIMNASFKCLVVHGIEAWKTLPWPKRLGTRRMNRIMSVSAYTEREMMQRNALAQDRFCVFPNTLDPRSASQHATLGRNALRLPQGPMLLSVARLASSEGYKNIRSVIESLPSVLARVPDTFYVIVGDGAKRKVFEQLAHSMGLADKVFLPGAVSDELLPSYYENCDLFVLPSIKEGFGIVFLEAMCHGKPCVGARSGGVPEVLRDGVSGLLVDPSNLATELPDAILRLLKDPALCRAMGAQGRADLETKFSFASFRGRLEQILCSRDHRVAATAYAREA
jgi:glycosyltransferase involved in cell wall biosynthesis